MFSILLPLLAQAAALEPAPTPRPDLEELRAEIAANDSALFWAAFEDCDPAALEDLLTEDFRMLHDLAGLAVTDRASFIASLEEQCTVRGPGGENEGYSNRRLSVPGSRIVRPLGDWGALEEGAHTFFEWRGADRGWVMTGGARYMHVWRWMPQEGRLRLTESLSYDHGAAPEYPPAGSQLP